MPKNLDFQCKWSLSLEIVIEMDWKKSWASQEALLNSLNTGNFSGSTYN